MRRNDRQRPSIPYRRPTGPLGVLALIAFSTGCHDARISIDQFVAMQRAVGRQHMEQDLGTYAALQTAGSTTAKHPQQRRFVEAPTTSKIESSATAQRRRNARRAAQAVSKRNRTPSARTPTPSANKKRVIQVRNGNQSLRPLASSQHAEGQWFFDAIRGEWIRRSLPQRQLNIRSVAHQQPEPTANEDAMTDENAPALDWDHVEIESEPAPTTTEAAESSRDESIPITANAVTSQPVFAPTTSPAKRPYLLGPEDVITVSLTGLSGIDTLSEATEVNARIAHDGTINLPLVGAIDVAGYDVVDAEKAIRAAYVPRFVPTLAVGVQIAQFKTTDIVVVGAAQLPGLVYLRRNERDVLHAVAAAGGMAQNASGEVILRRINQPDSEIRLFLRDPAKLRSVLALDPLQSGDVVDVVAAQPNTIFVGGLVNLPGPREFPPGTKVSILQALAASGGVIEDVFPKEGTLIRSMPNGEDVHVKLDLDRLRSGKDPNLQLAAGDILWVPETFGTRTMAFLNQSLFFRAGATVSYNVTGVEYLNRPAVQNGTVLGNGNLRNSVDPLGFLVP